jgi:hypothetical protein
MWKVSVCVHACGGTPKHMACRTRHGAGVRGSAQRPHVAPRPARRRPAAADGGGSGRSPSPRPDRGRRRPAAGVRPAGRTASRPTRGWGGVRQRGGQPGTGRRWRGCHGKRGFIWPILSPLPSPASRGGKMSSLEAYSVWQQLGSQEVRGQFLSSLTLTNC